MTDGRNDFFISHTRADRQWATWIAQTLIANDYTVRLQEWDFRPGNNFVVKMQEAAAAHERVLAVLSPDYLERSPFGTPEWAAAFADDPTGAKRQLIPVIVRDVRNSGLLNQIVPIKLVGLGETEAIAELLEGVGSGERHQTETVAFPGSTARKTAGQPDQSQASAPAGDWAALDTEVSVPYRPTDQRSSWASNVVLELYAVPVPAKRIQAVAFRQAADSLAGYGRSAKFFTGMQSLGEEHDAHLAIVQAQPDRSTSTRGLLLSKGSALGIWEGVAQDSMGAVIDSADIEQRLERLLRLVLKAPYFTETRYTLAARIVTNGIYIFGDASTVGHRSGAGGLHTANATFDTAVDDSVTADTMSRRPSEIAAELAARLESVWTAARRSSW